MPAKRSVLIAGHPTSVTLEDAFWDELKEMAAARGLSMNALVEEIDGGRQGNLSSALRLAVLSWLKEQARGPAATGPASPV